ncbi:unnamed protein product [Echinostoma caproni]|uniref:Integrase catalytic domain-containing protein n=1 Tax=Echinostoma caproni TaxID=27848 RepID=A0A183BF92_9TREM|nr:unnamed protein product [Echinostoma caproni]
MAWQRFVGRRGNPSNVFSDNGSNFVGPQKELSNWLMQLDKCARQDRLSPSGTQWHFNPPYSSHHRHLEPNGTSTHLAAVTAEEFGNGLYGRCKTY